MKIMKFILITCLPVAGLYCHAEIPPLEPSVEDPSTGLNVQPGFEVELIYKVDKRKFGSWIAMAFDEKGLLTVSDQGGAGTFRLQVPNPGKAFDEGTIEKLNVKSSQWGMLYAFDYLYMMGNRNFEPSTRSGGWGSWTNGSNLRDARRRRTWASLLDRFS